MIEKEAWYREAERLPTKGYHVTTEESWSEIQKSGLVPGSAAGFSRGSLSWMTGEGFYPQVPVFLSTEPSKYAGEVLLEVDVSGLPIWPDLPALVDEGAYVEEGGVLYWEDGREVEVDLEDPSLTARCIKMTSSFTVPVRISPDRITRR